MKFQKEEKKGGMAETNVVVGGDEALAVGKKRIKMCIKHGGNFKFTRTIFHFIKKILINFSILNNC